MKLFFKKALVIGLFFAFGGCVGGGERSVVTFLFTSSNNGVLSNCLCPANPWGGLARRKTLLDSLRRVEENCLLLDTGNFLSSYHRGENDRKVVAAYTRLGYAAVNLGAQELRNGLSFFRSVLVPSGLPLVSANLEAKNTGERLGAPCRSVMVGGSRVVIVGLMSSEALAYLPVTQEQEFQVVPFLGAIRTTLAEVGEVNDILVVLSQLTESENRQLVDAFPGRIDAILGDCSRDRPQGAYRVYRGAILAKAGVDGGTVGILRMTLDVQGRRSEQTVAFVPVVERLLADPELNRLLNQ